MRNLLPVLLTTALYASAAPFAQAEDVTWTSAANVSVSGNSLTKTSGGASWNAGAISTADMMWGPAYVEFVATETTGRRICGLSYGNTDSGFNDIDFGIYLANATVRIYESSWHRGDFGTYVAGDRFRVEAEPGRVRYLKNGVVFFTGVGRPRFPILVDASLQDVGAKLSNVTFGTSVFTKTANVAISGNSLTKTGSSGWTSGASSVARLELGDGFVEATALETTTNRAIGLTRRDKATTVADIEYAIELHADGTYSVMEAGTSRGNFGAYATDDVFRVAVQAGAVQYLRNGALVYLSDVPPAYPLLVDAAFNTAGATLSNIQFVTLLWSNGVGVETSGPSITKTTPSGTNGGVVSVTTLQSDGWLEFSAQETNTSRVVGLSHDDADQTPADIDFGVHLKADGTAAIVEGGINRAAVGTYVTGDRFRVEVVNGSEVRYRKNGILLYTSVTAATLPLLVDTSLDHQGATVKNVAVGTLVWTADVGVKIDAGGLRRIAPDNNWGNAGALSSISFSGDGFVEWIALAKGEDHHTVGLGHTDSNVNYTDIEYAMNVSGTAVKIYESGTLRGTWSPLGFADRLRVQVSNNVVTYHQNDTLLYTSGVAPTYPLAVDTSIWSAGSSIGHLNVWRASSSQTVATPQLTPGGGAYQAPQNVVVTCSTAGVQMRYTTNGAEPTESDGSVAHLGTIAVEASQTLRVKAWKSGWTPSAVASATYALKVATPSLTPNGTTYSTPQTVVIASTTPDARLYYTTDGSEPDESDTFISSGSSLPVDQTQTLRVRGFRTGWTPSDTRTGVYTMQVGTPAISVGDGTHAGPLNVTVSTVTPAASLHYTTNGAVPTASSPMVASGSSIIVDRSMTLRVVGMRAGWNNSDMTSRTYIIQLGAVAVPTFDPPAGTYTAEQLVSIATTTPDATIRYTVDGSDPDFQSMIYSAPLVVDASMVLKARAFKADWLGSATSTAAYTLSGPATCTPVLLPPPGTYSIRQTVTVHCDTPGAELRYTLDGRVPTLSDPLIGVGTSLPSIDRDTVVKVKAWKTGLAESKVRQGTYLITGAVAAWWGYSLALTSDGAVYSWGIGGVLGVGDTAPRTAPVQVLDPSDPTGFLSDVVAIAAGSSALALKSNGTVVRWGTGALTPVAVPGLTNVAKIVSGYRQYAVKKDGTVWHWRGTATPQQVAHLSGITSVAAAHQAQDHGLAVRTNGARTGHVLAWGFNDFGQLGDGTVTNNYLLDHGHAPVGVAEAITEVLAGEQYSLALTGAGAVLGWGNNDFGKLGTGTTTHVYRPASMLGSLTVGRLAAGFGHTLAVDHVGQLWGLGRADRLGTGLTTSNQPNRPVAIPLPDVVDIAAGHWHSLATRSDGRVWVFGHNYLGAVAGTGEATTDYPTAVLIPNLRLAENVGDLDGDGLSNALEVVNGSDPGTADTNGDGIPDGIAAAAGKSLTDTDMDDDGLLNADELAKGTDPFVADTDNDGTLDGSDCFPLDPSRTQCPAPTDGDSTGPVITLTEPTNAVLVQ